MMRQQDACVCRRADQLRRQCKQNMPKEDVVGDILQQLCDSEGTVQPESVVTAMSTLTAAVQSQEDTLDALSTKRNLSLLIRLFHLRGTEQLGAIGQTTCQLLVHAVAQKRNAASTARTAGAIPPLVHAARLRCTYTLEALQALTYITSASMLSTKVLEQTCAPSLAVQLAHEAIDKRHTELCERALALLAAMCKQNDKPTDIMLPVNGYQECAHCIGMLLRRGMEQSAYSLCTDVLDNVVPGPSASLSEDDIEAADILTLELMQYDALPFAAHCTYRASDLLVYHVDSQLSDWLKQFPEHVEDVNSTELQRFQQIVSLSRLSYGVACKVASFLLSDETALISMLVHSLVLSLQHVHEEDTVAALTIARPIAALIHATAPELTDEIVESSQSSSLCDTNDEERLIAFASEDERVRVNAEQSVKRGDASAHELVRLLHMLNNVPPHLCRPYIVMVQIYLSKCVHAMGEQQLEEALEGVLEEGLRRLSYCR